MSWKKALDIIDGRIGLRSDVGGGSLPHWRRVIGKAYADLQVGFLGPSLLVSLALGEDGRTEDSRFPNLLSQVVRERYLLQD